MSAEALANYARFFETLKPETLPRLAQLTTSGVRFRDPFNDVEGQRAMRRVFESMFKEVVQPRFVVLAAASAGSIGFLTWQFSGLVRSKEWVIIGVSQVTFASDGRVCAHVDYWDAATQVYERLPLLGWLLRRLRRRLSAAA